jgi:hypothetical protein
MPKHSNVSRRTMLKTAAAATVPAMPRIVAAAEPIKIGMPFALTGPSAGIGAQMRRACEFWAKSVNAKGGLLGRPVELIIEETPPATPPPPYARRRKWSSGTASASLPTSSRPTRRWRRCRDWLSGIRSSSPALTAAQPNYGG